MEKNTLQLYINDIKGITLVAVVITIIVLLILAGVSISLVTGDNGILTKAQEAAKKSNVEGKKEEIKVQVLSEITANNGKSLSNDALKDILQKYGDVKYESDGITVDGVKTSNGDEILLSDIGVTNNNNVKKELIGDGGFDGTVNSPKLAQGMTGIYWDDLGNEVTVTLDNKENWYDYTNKKWANAKTLDGSYFVWIPRYQYKIPNVHSSTAQTIDVKFIENESTIADAGYTMQPGFTFGETELTGIWVAKFEASGTISSLDVKPNVISLRSITIDQMFTACRNMEVNTRYGWNSSGTDIDSHLMKNIEWGACAYLSSSQFGKTGEVWINPNSNYITGQVGTSVSSAATISTYAYNNMTYGINASTTGNIYGIYDMSGGAWEYTAAYVNNGNSSLTSYAASLVNSAAKYKDLYTSSGDTYAGNYSASSSKKGDAVYETSGNVWGSYSWYSDYTYMPYSSNPIFARGGHGSITTNSGVFAVNYYSGSANNSRISSCYCFRKFALNFIK